MKKKIVLITLFILLNTHVQISKADINIDAIIDGKVITNHDIEKESEYLKVLNKNLSQLNQDQISTLAKNSLIKEIIKKEEIIKVIDINQDNPFVKDYLKDLYSKLNYKNEDEFLNELAIRNTYNIEQIKEKISIELFWNELIYLKYSKLLKINKEKLINKIENLEDKTQNEYFLSEIVFNKKKDQTLESLVNQIKISINEIGFSNTATIYSISESSKLGGKLGWVNENSLSKLILNKVSSVKEGENTDIIKIGNNNIIIKIDQIRINTIEIDKEKELKKLITAETNKQLNQFSRIYFDKSKINYSIDEK
jgi:peptidyl-prolyl cis-trans isomerase SurA